MSTHVELNPEVLEGCVRSELQRAQRKGRQTPAVHLALTGTCMTPLR
jgi:hypothetical protein